MARVFISYCTPQRPTTQALADFFAKQRCSVWWDRELQPNQKFQSEIQRQLRKARAVVVIWSRDSIRSEWVLAEAEYAWRRGKLVNAHTSDFPPGDIPAPFRQVHAVAVGEEQRLLRAVSRLARWSLLKDAAKTAAAVAMLGGMVWATGVAPGLRSPVRGLLPGPEWKGETQTFIGKPFLLAWAHEPTGGARAPGPSQITTFEIEKAADERFAADIERFFVEGHYRVFPQISNRSAYWRIRAVDPQTHAALSSWSTPRQFAHYDSTLRKIAETGKLDVHVSLSEYKDVFKWTDEKNGLHGFEPRLAAAVASRLARHAGLSRPPTVAFGRTAWPRILEIPATGRADLILSGISKRRERERQFALRFSDTYFCTPQSIVARAGEDTSGGLLHLLATRRMGLQELTTSQMLFDRLRTGGNWPPAFAPKTQERPEMIIQDLIAGSIDVALVDLPFAVESSRQSRSGERAAIAYRAIRRSDVPAGFPDEALFDEYAMAGIGDPAFLRAINAVLAEMKSSGDLLALMHQAADDFEDSQGRPRGSLRFERSREQPWQCEP